MRSLRSKPLHALIVLAMMSVSTGCVGTKGEPSVAAAAAGSDARALCGDPVEDWSADFQDALLAQLVATERGSPLWEVYRQAEDMREQITICRAL